MDRPKFGAPYIDGDDLALDAQDEDLTERADRVLRAHSRLKALLRAVATMSATTDFLSVLRRFVGTVADLVDAEYAALETDEQEGSLPGLFVATMRKSPSLLETESGTPPEASASPRDVSAPISDTSVFLADSGAVLDIHPGQQCCWSISVMVGGVTFGTLDLCSGQDRQFSAEEVELVTALTTLAGNVMHSALLLHEAEVRERWGRASSRMSAALLSAEGGQSMKTIADELVSLRPGDRIVLVEPGSAPNTVHVAQVRGPQADGYVDKTLATEDSMAGIVLAEGQPRVVKSGPNGADEPFGLSSEHGSGPVLFLPLFRMEEVRAVLVIALPPTALPLSAVETDGATLFAARLSLVLDLIAAREDHAQERDRARIARDLHDHVVQILYSVALDLKHSSRRDPALASSANSMLTRLSDAMKRIRMIIFSINPREQVSAKRAVVDLATEASKLLRNPVTVNLSGPVDTVVTGSLLNDVTAVVRETLANAVKHADADHVVLSVFVADDTLTVSVEDSGAGWSSTNRGSRSGGLANMYQRALGRRGTFEVSKTETGTLVVWSVPLR